MPSIFDFLGYKFYFWSNEGVPLEPVHVHFTKGSPAKGDPKAYLLEDKSIVFSDENKVSKKDLSRIKNIIITNYDLITEEWYNRFNEISFKN